MLVCLLDKLGATCVFETDVISFLIKDKSLCHRLYRSYYLLFLPALLSSFMYYVKSYYTVLSYLIAYAFKSHPTLQVNWKYMFSLRDCSTVVWQMKLLNTIVADALVRRCLRQSSNLQGDDCPFTHCVFQNTFQSSRKASYQRAHCVKRVINPSSEFGNFHGLLAVKMPPSSTSPYPLSPTPSVEGKRIPFTQALSTQTACYCLPF